MHEPYDPLRSNPAALEKWNLMVTELQHMGFTYRKGKSAWAFKCRHGKVEFRVYRNMKAYRNGDWDYVTDWARSQERKLCSGN